MDGGGDDDAERKGKIYGSSGSECDEDREIRVYRWCDDCGNYLRRWLLP